MCPRGHPRFNPESQQFLKQATFQDEKAFVTKPHHNFIVSNFVTYLSSLTHKTLFALVYFICTVQKLF